MEIANLFKYVAAFLGAFLLCDLLTKAVLNFCKKHSLVDAPGERKLHTAPIPRLGGVALNISFISFLLLFSFAYGHLADQDSFSAAWCYDFVFPLIVLFIVGLLDDLYSLSPLAKLAGQITAATLLITQGTTLGSISYFQFSPLLDFSLTLFWFLLVVNAFNLIDGLDGLASGIAAIAGLGLFGIFMISNAVFPALIALVFVGAVCGFLRHNFHPAKIFLGDSGSMMLGFCLAAFTLQSPSKSSTIATFGACILAIGVPLLDTALAVWRRSLRAFFSEGKGVMSADMDHLHHRLVKRGINQKGVALSLYALSGALVTVGLLTLLFESYSHGIYLIAFTFGTYIIFRHLAHVELWDSGNAIVRGISKPSSSMVTAVLYPVADVLALSTALFLSLTLTAQYANWGEFRELFVALLPEWVGITFIAIGLAATYERVWSRARVSEFVYLILAFMLGAVLSAGISKLVRPEGLISDPMLFTALFIGIGGGLLTAIRALPRVVADLMFFIGQSGSHTAQNQKRVVVIGADVLLLRSLKNREWGEESGAPIKVVGLLDPDRNLRKRIVHGYRVLGTPEELPQLFSELKFEEVLINDGIEGVDLDALAHFGLRNGVAVRLWRVEESTLTARSFPRPELIRETAVKVDAFEELSRDPEVFPLSVPASNK